VQKSLIKCEVTLNVLHQLRIGKDTLQMLRKTVAATGLFLMFSFLPALAAGLPARNYTVVFENSRVRVLRAHIDASERTVPHELRDAVVIPLTDYSTKLTVGGKTTEMQRKAGEAAWLPASARSIEAGNKPIEAIVVELKK